MNNKSLQMAQMNIPFLMQADAFDQKLFAK
jgi:hypothetical protein